MSVALDIHQRKGALKTILIGIVLLLILLFFGLRHYDPPLERGIIIALGTSEGTTAQNSSKSAQSTESSAQQEASISEPTEVIEEVDRDTADNTEVESTSTEAQIQESTQEITPAEEELLVAETSEVPVVSQQEPKPDAATAEALKRVLSGQSTSLPNTQNNQDTSADPAAQDNELTLGAPEGSPLSESPYNLGIGLDGDGNYLLGGRRALYKEVIIQECNQAGRVVVSIEVNQKGEVVTAMPGVRGTTNNAPCLLDPARRAALATQFNPDLKAPSRQIGKIIYVFRLSQ
ncbi:MAG: energy transducer TonB [Flavobacteriaceae bacterium]|nr:energy transducer TonB [Flavobacteriaceae bacterium]